VEKRPEGEPEIWLKLAPTEVYNASGFTIYPLNAFKTKDVFTYGLKLF
jgi:hypothetical protein